MAMGQLLNVVLYHTLNVTANAVSLCVVEAGDPQYLNHCEAHYGALNSPMFPF